MTWTPVAKQVETWSGETTGSAPWLPKQISFLALFDGASLLMLSASPYAIELENQTSNEPQFT